MNDRKGLLTDTQEKIAAKYLKEKNVPKLVARIGIKLIDNRLIDPLIDRLDQDKRNNIYKIIDSIFKDLEVEVEGIVPPDEDRPKEPPK